MNIGGLFGDDDNGQGLGVITASQAEEYAMDTAADPVALRAETSHSVFAKALIEGLRSGDADLDGDGRISFDDLYQYVHRRVVDAGVAQTPGRWNWVRGTLVVAHRVPATRPEPQASGPNVTAGSGDRTLASHYSPWDAALLDWRFAVTPAVDRLLSVQARTSAERYGWGLLRNGEWSTAAGPFMEAVRLSGNGSAWWGRAICHAAEGQWDAAGHAFEWAANGLAASLHSSSQRSGAPLATELAGLCGAAALLGAVTFAAAGSPRVGDVLDAGLERAQFCPQLLAYQGRHRNERAPLSLALRLDPSIADDFTAVGLDIEQAVLDAVTELERRLDVLTRERDRIAALARRVPTARENPPAPQALPGTTTARKRLDACHRRVQAEREALADWVHKLRRDALQLLTGIEMATSELELTQGNVLIEVVQMADLAIEGLRRTEIPPPVTALGVPPRLEQ